MLENQLAQTRLKLVTAIQLSDSDITAAAGKHRVIEVSQGAAKDYYYLQIDHPIGEGGFGKVYKAVKIDPHTGKVDEKAHPAAVKIPINTEKALAEIKETAEEIAIQKNYFSNTFLARDKKNFFMFTELLNAQELFDFQYTKGPHNENPPLASSSLEQRLALIEQIMLGINIIHHNTIRTGGSIIHKDLKPENIMVAVGQKGEMSAYIIDFGIAHKLNEDDPSRKIETESRGTDVYMAPEVFNGKAGLKSDMYSLVPVFAGILGAFNPTKSKVEYADRHGFKSEIGQIKFNFEQIWDWAGSSPPAYYDFIKDSFQKFLEKMEGNYDQRPSSDEGLRFIVEMRKYAKLNQMLEKPEKGDPDPASIHADIEICKAKIDIITHGLWDQKFDTRLIEKFTASAIQQYTANAAVSEEDSTTKKPAERVVPSSYKESARTIGDILQSNPELAVSFSNLLMKNKWELSDETLSQMKALVPDSGMQKVLIALQSEWHPKMSEVVQNLSKHPTANQLMQDIADRGQMNRTVLLAINHAKDNPKLFNHLVEVFQNPKATADERNKVARSVVTVALVAKELADKKGSLEPERLVELTEKLFEQRGNIPKSELLSVFKEIVEQYVAHKEALNDALGYEGLFGRFGGYTNQAKIDAARELIDASRDPNKKLDGALAQGKLGTMAKMIDEVAHQPESLSRGPK